MNLEDLQKKQPQPEKKSWVSPVLTEEVISETNSGQSDTVPHENQYYHS